MVIPKIIHQTWKSCAPPPVLKKFMDTWKRHHAGWEYMLWTDEMNRAFIKEVYPWFLQRYDSYSNNIQRVDAARYFILFHYGGVYIDLDFLCLDNIEPILEKETCVLGKEPAEHCSTHNKEVIVSNAFIACTPKHAFLQALCREIYTNMPKTDHRNDLVLQTTGPFMLTDLLQRCPADDRPLVLDFDILYPLTKDELAEIGLETILSKADHRKLKNAYAVHYYWGTWWKGNHYL